MLAQHAHRADEPELAGSRILHAKDVRFRHPFPGCNLLHADGSLIQPMPLFNRWEILRHSGLSVLKGVFVPQG